MTMLKYEPPTMRVYHVHDSPVAPDLPGEWIAPASETGEEWEAYPSAQEARAALDLILAGD